MKRILFLIALSCGVLFATNSQAQIFRLGIKAGATFSKFSTDYDVLKDNNTGFQVGLMSRIKIPIIGLAIHPELLYTSIGSDESKLNYFQVPVNLQWGVDLKVVRPFIQAGPYWGYALGSSGDNKFSLSKIHRSDWGLGLGAGIELFNHLQVAFKYDWGLTNLNKDDILDGKFKNRTFNLSIGYMF